MAKRGQNEGSIYKRDDGRWVAQVNLGYVNGKRKRKYVYGDTRAEVKSQLTTLLHDQEHGNPIVSKQVTVAEYLDHWLEQAVKPTMRPRTHDSYCQLVRLYLAPALGRKRLDKLTALDVQSFMNDMLAAGLSPRTVQYARAVLRRALNQAIRWQMIARNVATLVDGPKVERHEIAPLTPEQARAFLDSVVGHRLEALYSVALAIGLRQGEALGLRWQDIDLDAGVLSVRKQLQRIDGKLQLTDPKTTMSRRTIALPAVTVAALRRHRVRQLEDRLLAGERWQDGGLVFTSTIGTPLDARNVVRQFHKVREQVECPEMRFHDLRHTCATLLLAQGVPPRVIMETLGHSQISLTMNTYTHVIPALQREAANLMDALLTGSG